MSDRILTEEEKAAAARRGPAGARQGGPPHMALGAPGEKPKSFLASAKRLLGLLRPERALVILAITMGFIAVVLQAAGPRILGWATDRHLPLATTTLTQTRIPHPHRQSLRSLISA